MCFTIPYKVTGKSNRSITVENKEEKKQVENTLVNVQEGDYVMVQQKTIIQKIPKEEAKETLKLIYQ